MATPGGPGGCQRQTRACGRAAGAVVRLLLGRRVTSPASVGVPRSIALNDLDQVFDRSEVVSAALAGWQVDGQAVTASQRHADQWGDAEALLGRFDAAQEVQHP